MFNDEIIEWANDPFIIKCIETRNNLLASANPTYSADYNSKELRLEYSSEVRDAIENINKSIVDHITKRFPKHRSGIEELKRYEVDLITKQINYQYERKTKI